MPLDHADFEVLTKPDPLRPETYQVRMAAGASVDDVVRQFCTGGLYLSAVVVLSRGPRAWVVPRDMWAGTRPKAGTKLEVVVPDPKGGLAALALSAALPGVSSFLAGSVLGLTGPLLTIATAAFTVVGSLAISALIPPPEQPASGSPFQAITGTQNRANPGGIVPVICGRRRITPLYSATPLQETVGDEIYFVGRYTLGQAPCAVSEIKIGETPIQNFDDLEIEFLNVSGALSNLPDAVRRKVRGWRYQAQTMQLMDTDVTTDIYSDVFTGSDDIAVRRTRVDTTFAKVDLDFPAGLYDVKSDGGVGAESVQWRIRYRKVGASSWTAVIPDRNGGVNGRIPQQIGTTFAGAPIYDTLDYVRRDADGTYRVNGEVVTVYQDGLGPNNYPRITLQPPSAEPDGAGGETIYTGTFLEAIGKDSSNRGIWQVSGDDGASRMSNTSADFEASSSDPGLFHLRDERMDGFRITQGIQFPSAGQYDIEIDRVSSEESDGDQAGFRLSSIQCYSGRKLVSHPSVAEMVVRIRSTDQLNGQIEGLNLRYQQLGNVWNGTRIVGWTPIRHPAWTFLTMLTGRQAVSPATPPKSQLDYLKRFAEEEPDWTCDLVLDQDQRVEEALKTIAATGRCTLDKGPDGSVGLLRDHADAPVRSIINPRDTWGFSATVTIPPEIHAFDVEVWSEASQGIEPIRVYADGHDATTATKIETLSLPGVVVGTNEDGTQGNAFKLARYFMAVSKLRRERFSFSTDIAGELLPRGSKHRLVHDVPSVGIGQGRIKSRTPRDGLTELVIDEVYPFVGNVRLTIRIETVEDGQPTVAVVQCTAYSDGNGIYNVFSAPPAFNEVKPGDLLNIEETTAESLDVIIDAVVPGEDRTFEVTCIPAAAAVLLAADGPIPDFVPVVRVDGPRPYGPPAPVVAGGVGYSDRSTASKSRDGLLQPRIAVRIEPIEGLLRTDQLQLRWRPIAGGPYRYASFDVDALAVSGRLVNAVAYEAAVRIVNRREGEASPWVEAGPVVASVGPTLSFAPGAWTGTPITEGVLLKGDKYFGDDASGWRVYGATSASGPWILLGVTQVPNFLYTGTTYTHFRVVAIDPDGKESPPSPSTAATPKPIKVTAGNVQGQLTDGQLQGIDALKLIGQIANAQIKDVAAAKLIGKLIDSQIDTIAAGKIFGKLTDAQLEAIAAAKITGTITDQQLAGLSATKLTGQITNSQIVALAATKLLGQISETQITDKAITTPKLATGAVAAGSGIIGNLAVETLHIGNNAVTAPLNAYNAAPPELPWGSSPQTRTMILSSYPRTAGLETRLLFTMDGYTNNMPDGTYYDVSLQMFRNGVVIEDVTRRFLAYKIGGIDYTGALVLSATDMNTSGGTVTYRVDATLTVHGASFGKVIPNNAGIQAIEFRDDR